MYDIDDDGKIPCGYEILKLKGEMREGQETTDTERYEI